jgi:hypothetical protein
MKHYTYEVICSFTMQYTFTADEVEQGDGTDPGEFEPTETALAALREEVREHLQLEFFGVDDLNIEAETDNLLGIEDDTKE